MAWFSTDSLRTAIAAVNPFAARGQVQGIVPGVMNHQMALTAFRSSGMLRKVITVPAEDRVREWRDWQAEKPQIELIEAEEKRLGLVAKVRQAEVLRGIGGGALILAAPGLPTDELKPETIRKGGLQAINVVSRWQITGRDYVKELTDPAFGTPRLFEIAGENGAKTIHPSRVICFRGDPLPAGAGLGEEDAFWGDSRLVRVLREVENSDATQRWFAELVKKAKLLRIGIPDLADMLATPGGQAKLEARVATIANGESILNATVFSSAAKDGAGETITDYQVTWAGIPAMMDAFDQRVAAVADIPFTRLMGRSPAGMNATGQYDDISWSKSVQAAQQLETRPCLEQLDPVLIRSAGVADPGKVTWKWAPLWSPTEKELAETFKTEMEAVELLRGMAAIPEVAFNKGVQNLMSEREYIPGLDAALAEIPEAERFGIAPENDDTDPSSFQATGTDNGGKEAINTSPTTRGAGGSNGAPARAVNDAKAIPLSVQRKLLNADELVRWAKGQGFKTTLDPSDMHVTILYSRTPVDPIKMGTTWSDDQKGNLTVKPGGPRAVEKLGDTAVVLLFASDDLSWRHRSMVEAGASHDYDEYQPHVTISYEVPEGLDIEAIKPFTGALRFGPELFEPLDLDWKSKVTEE